MMRVTAARHFVLVPCLLVVTSCASAPPGSASERAVFAGTLAEGFDCAMREVNEAGFLVTEADRGSGFLRAERNRTGVVDAVLGGTQGLDELTVTLYQDRDRQTVIRVTPGRAEIRVRGENQGDRVSRAPDRESRAAAAEILSACGTSGSDPEASAHGA